MGACTFRIRPRAYTGDAGAVCGREETDWYWRANRFLPSCPWEERCDEHAPLTETSERIPTRRGKGGSHD